MKRNALNLALGVAALAPVAVMAQPAQPSPQAAEQPLPAAQDAVAHKCRGKIRLGCRPASKVSQTWQLPPFEVEPEPTPTETLAQALQSAYETAPSLQAHRYQLRSNDEDYAQALSELRPSSQVQITATYDKTVPGRITQLNRPILDKLASSIITSNTLAAQGTLTQPLYTGGKAAADRDAATAEIRAGRQALRGTEGDLLLQVITAYASIRRDDEDMRLYSAFLGQLQATLEEVKARQEAGELTRTDIAQAETQLKVAQTQANTTREQLEQDRATYAAYVGRNPGALAPLPALPHVPGSVSDAFAVADQISPDIAQAIETERQSRAKIASAKAQGKPTVSLIGTAILTGQGYPFYLHNDDQEFQGQAVVTIPITTGGLVRSLVAQAQDKNSADRIGIEAARRQMVDSIINAWNGIATNERNIEIASSEVTSAKTFDEGTFMEYRAGLRSTFDVLYAHSTLLNAKIALVSAQHDLYVAEATLLRYIGLLETRTLLTGTGIYDPEQNLRRAEARGAGPLDGVVRAIDTIDRAPSSQKGLQQPPLGDDKPEMAPATSPLPDAATATTSPIVPIPGTIGTPVPDRSLTHP